jgi:hypothetical protein
MAVRLFAILAAVTFIATSRYSHTVFVTSIVVVAVVGILFAVGVIQIRRHFARYPMYPKPTEPADDGRSNSE